MRRTLVLIALLLAARPNAARAQASTYLPIRDWTTPYIEHLIRLGIINDPAPLTRPLRRVDVVDALRRADTARADAAQRETISELLAWLGARDSGGVVYRLEGDLGGTASTQRRRDVLHPLGDAYASYHGDARLSVTAGSVAASVHPYADSYLCLDPDFKGAITCKPPGRITDAYVSVQGEHGEFFLGAIDRNWGIPGIDGFLTSSYPYSYDHLYAWVGTEAVKIEALATQLDDFVTVQGLDHRYWMSSRVRIQPWPWLVASFDNGTLWYGVDRGFELRFLNPLKLSFITGQDDAVADQQNNILEGEIWLRLPGHVTVQSGLLIDAIRSGPLGGTHTDPFPDRLGWNVALDAPVSNSVGARVWGQMVTAFAYRAPEGVDNSIMLRGIGLGQNYADYLEMGMSASFLPAPLITLSPEIVLRGQGQGDFRLPTPNGFVDGPTLFAGIVETTWRVGLKAHARFGRLDLDGDGGIHFRRNVDHIEGANATTLVGRIGVTIQLFNEAWLGN